MINDEFPMTNQCQNPKVKKNYNLTERTSKFSAEIIIFAKTIKETNINRPIINQLISATTSIGANYMEADCAESKKDFNHKIGICKKESKETAYWLHMLAISEPDKKNAANFGKKPTN